MDQLLGFAPAWFEKDFARYSGEDYGRAVYTAIRRTIEDPRRLDPFLRDTAGHGAILTEWKGYYV